MIALASIREDIEAADRQFEMAFNGGNAAGVAQLYTEDAQIFPPQSDVISGRPGIQAFWQAVMDMGVKTAKLETVEAVHEGDSAFEVGRYTLAGAAGQVLDQGKYIVIWHRHGAEWKLHRDIWNTSVPPSG